MSVKHVEKEQEMREGIKKSDQFKLDITTARLTLALTNITTQTSIFEGSIRVFGIDGVGGIKSEKVTVQIDGKKAKVWLDSSLHSSLWKKIRDQRPPPPPLSAEDFIYELRKPDELAKIPNFQNYVPIFKALSNCGLSITSAESAVNVYEIGSKLDDEYSIISTIKNRNPEDWLVRRHGEKIIAEARERYKANKITKKTQEDEKAAHAFRVRFESYQFEKELEEGLFDTRGKDVNRVLTAPGGKKVTLSGQRQTGVIATDDFVAQLDKDTVKVFVESNVQSRIQDRFMKEGGTAQEACNAILKDPQSLGDEFLHIAIILKAFSESKIQVVELYTQSKKELEKKAELLLEQDWIASQYSKNTSERPKKASKEDLSATQKKVLQELLETVGDPEKVNNALARYEIIARVVGVKVERNSEAPKDAENDEEDGALEIPLVRVRHKLGSEGQLAQRILDKLELMKNGMVDDKIDGMEAVGFGYLKTLSIYNDVVIKVMKGKSDRAFVLMDKEFLQATLDYARTKKDFNTYRTHAIPEWDHETVARHIDLLSGDERFVEVLAAFKAFNAAGVKHFIIKSRREDAYHYMEDVRETCRLPAMIHEGFEKGMVAETIKMLLQKSTAEEIVEKLMDSGFESEAKYVEEEHKKTKSSEKKVRELLRSWTESNKVPERDGLLKSIASIGTTKKEFERKIESEVLDMKKSIQQLTSSIKGWEEKKDRSEFSTSMHQENIQRYIKQEQNRIAENNKMIAKAEEALVILRGG